MKEIRPSTKVEIDKYEQRRGQERVAVLLAEGVEFSEIGKLNLDYLRKRMSSSDLYRAFGVTRQDYLKLSRRYNLGSYTRRYF